MTTLTLEDFCEQATPDITAEPIRIDGVAYRLRPFARGGCAAAYRGAPDSKAAGELLFKVPHRHVLARDLGLRQWQRECGLLSSIRHPAIPSPVAIRNAPFAYMAYPFIPGANLRQHIRERRQAGSAREATTLGMALLRVLGYLHRRPKPIAHGDVRPHNLLLDHAQQLRLIDFGCAAEAGSCGYHPWVAAPRYLSPEQAKGHRWNHRSDLYQAGLVIYELLTGSPYNQGANTRAAMLFACRPESFPMRSVARRAGRGFAHWLADLLEPDPANRIPSAHCAANLLLALIGTRA